MIGLVTDNRLSEGARLIGLWLFSQQGNDEGWVEARFDDLRGILYGFPSDDVIRKHLRMLRGSGWVERRPGGRGRGDLYRIDPPRSGPKDLDPTQSPPYSNLDPLRSDPKSLRPASEPTLRGDSRGVAVEEAVGAVAGEKNAGAPEATDVPKYELSPRAAEVLSERGDDLNGCRGALRDYLRARVKPEHQYGYAQTVVTWIDGGDWSVFRLRDGSRAESERIPKILGAAINELLAADEAMMKRPVGDPGNLKTKISILCKQRGDHDRSSGGRSDRSRKSGAAKPNPIRGDPSRRRRGPA